MRKEQVIQQVGKPTVHIFGEDPVSEPGKKPVATLKPVQQPATQATKPVLTELPKAIQAPGSAATAAATPKPVQQPATQATKPVLTELPKAVQAPELAAEKPAATTAKPVTQPKLTLKDQPKAILAPELAAQKEVGRTKAPSDEGAVKLPKLGNLTEGEKGRSFREPRVPTLAPELKGEQSTKTPASHTTKPLSRGIVKPILAPEPEERTPEQQITDRLSLWEKSNQAFLENFDSRYTNRQGDHTDAYVGDAQAYLEYVTNKSQDSIKELEAIRDLMIRYNYPPEDVADIEQRLELEKIKYAFICQTAKKDVDYWSQFEDAEDYKAQQDAFGLYNEMLGKDLKQLELGINWVESRTEKVIELIDKYLLINGKPYYAGKQGQLDALMQQIIENSAGWATVSHAAIISGQVKKDMEAAVRQARNYYYEAEKVQTLKKYDDTVNNEDFAQYSKAKGAPASMDEHEGWYIDEDYETYYDTENPHADRFRDMTDTEKAIYNYYLNKEGTDAAESYYEAIQDRLNRRSAEIDFQQMKGNTLLELEQAKWAGLGNFTRSLGGFIDALTGNEERKTPTYRQYLNGMIYEDLADVGGKIFGRSWGQLGFDDLENAANDAPTFIAGKAGGPIVDALITAVTSGGESYAELINEGYTKEEARTYAILKVGVDVGLSELVDGILEKGDKLTDNAIAKFVDNVDSIVLKTSIQMAGKFASAGMEEGLQELLTPWLKQCATGAEQDKANWTDVAYAALLGGLTAFAEAKDLSKEARVEFALKEMERIYKGDIPAKSQNTSVERNSGITGWDGRVAVKEATGKNVKMDGVTYKFLGYDKNGSPVYQLLKK